MHYNERHIFPGANTPKGFYSYYDGITDRSKALKFYCLKGGPGVGKSSYMKKIADYFLKEGEKVELFHCSSDPHSLDGIRLADYEIVMVDGTSPHIIDPSYPAAIDEIINLGDFWNANGIKSHKCEIIQTQHNISYEYSHAYKYLAAAEYISDDTDEIYNNATDLDGITRLSADIVKKVFQGKSNGGIKPVRKLFASALTPAGLINYSDTVLYDCEHVYAFSIGDDTGSLICADTIMSGIAREAYEKGYSCELFFCPMKPETRIEHIVLPEIKTGFTVLNRYNNDETVATEIYNLTEYVNRAEIRENADKISNNNEMYRELILNAENSLKNAYWLHNTLESYYVPYIRFDDVNEHCENTIKEIKKAILKSKDYSN